VLDSTGKILPWYKPAEGLAYDNFIRQAWEFLEHRVPIDPRTGVKVYLTFPDFDPETLLGSPGWQHNPPSLYSHVMDAMLRWYPYSGDTDAIEVVRGMLDYQLAHGTTPHDWDWADVPFATSCNGNKEYGDCLQDAPRRYNGGTETDKVGELGLSYVQMYEMTGERKYLDAGLHCADALARHIRPGDAAHTPWPYRIDAKTGAVVANQEYGGMIVAPVRLFDELLKQGFGNTEAYRKARDIAWKWIVDYPLNRYSPAWDTWVGYYEDQPHDMTNENDMDSIMVAYYILSQDNPSNLDKNWLPDVIHLIDRSRLILGRGPFFGAWGIDEQTGHSISLSTVNGELAPSNASTQLGTLTAGCCSASGLVCRTSQWAAVNAMLYAKTGDMQALEHAFRSLSYATYFLDDKNQVNCCGADFSDRWDSYDFEDSYGDAERSFSWAIAADPALFAPPRQDHVVASSSIIRSVKYEAQRVSYITFDQTSTETIRLSFLPESITAGSSNLSKVDALAGPGYTIRALAGGDYVVVVRHAGSREVVIAGKRG
jgi:hypothetical protein